MSKLDNLTDFLTSLANKFRGNLGTEDSINPQDFDSKVDEVYAAGKTEGEKWLDIYIRQKNVTHYHFAFTNWNVHCYKLTRPITKINGADSMYKRFNADWDIVTNASSTPVDLVELHKELGIPDIDWSTAKASCYQTLYQSKINHLGVMDLRNASHSQFFTNAGELVTIDMAMLNPNMDNYTSLFSGCPKLKNITFGSEIPLNISFSASPLTRESALSAMEHLKDFSGTGTTRTVTFSATTKALLSDEDKAIATQKGWTVA